MKVIRLIAWLVLAPVCVLVIGIGGCEVRKAYYDRQVRELCERHGGVQVHERIQVSAGLFNELGGQGGVMRLPNERERTPAIPAYQKIFEPVLLRSGSPSIARHEAVVVRASDTKILGRAVFFSRSGGDFPFTGSAPSYFQCPSDIDLVREVLEPQGDAK